MSMMSELKAEVARLSRKEIRKELEPIKRVNAAQRKFIANLRRDVTELQKEVARLQKTVGIAAPKSLENVEEFQNFRMTGKGVVSLRKRLGLTQTELAMLADVSQQTVLKWEKTNGKIPFRKKETPGRVAAIRSMGKKVAKIELEKLTEVSSPK